MCLYIFIIINYYLNLNIYENRKKYLKRKKFLGQNKLIIILESLMELKRFIREIIINL